MNLLYVVAVVSNPARYQRRYELFRQFCQRMECIPNVRLVTVELQQRHRPFVTDATIQLRTVHELWFKENLINVGVQYLPDDWEYVAWIDADIHFINDNWVNETLHQLQTYDVVQLFSHAIDLGPRGETIKIHQGFMYLYNRGVEYKNPKYGTHWHPGYAWACKKSAFNKMGGLIDWAILGSADNHMALALIGKVDESLNHCLHPHYIQMAKTFQERCERHIQRNVGHVDGTILHYWHGAKKNRFYKDRWKILVNNQYDPMRDIKRDDNGLYQLENYNIKLRDDLRHYFRSRNEDSIDND